MSQAVSSVVERRRYGALGMGMVVRSFRRIRLCSSTGGDMLADMVEMIINYGTIVEVSNAPDEGCEGFGSRFAKCECRKSDTGKRACAKYSRTFDVLLHTKLL